MSPSPQPAESAPSPQSPSPGRRSRWWWFALPFAVTMIAMAGAMRGDRSAEGVVLLQLGDRVPVAASSGGRLAAVLVGPGERVGAGQVVARLETDAGPVELTAPRDTLVGAVAVPSGRDVAAGEVVLWLEDRNVLPSLLVLFPERFREQLAPGMPLQYRLERIPFPIDTTIESVASPEESQRVARSRSIPGWRAGDGAVLVRARVPARNYFVDGRSRIYMDGMWGKATVPLR